MESESIITDTASYNGSEYENANSNIIPPYLTPKQEVIYKREKKRLEDEANLTFKPKIIVTSRSQRESDVDNDRFSRLYTDALKRSKYTYYSLL